MKTVEMMIVSCGGECFGAFTPKQVGATNFGDSDIELVFIPENEFESWLSHMEVFMRNQGEQTNCNSASIVFYEAVKAMLAIEKRGLQMKQESIKKNLTIEEALDSIHADSNVPLNMVNLANRTQQIDGSITSGDLWDYMQDKYGWESEKGFWSGDQIG